MAHKLYIYDLADVTGISGCDIYGPIETLLFEDADELRAEAIARARAAGHPHIVMACADPDLCADIPAFAAIENITADLCDLGIREKCWTGRLVSDPEYWAELGISTPLELSQYLQDCDAELD